VSIHAQPHENFIEHAAPAVMKLSHTHAWICASKLISLVFAVSAPSQFRSKEISKSNVVDDMVQSNRECFLRLSLSLSVFLSVSLAHSPVALLIKE
jgi:hypothetical protein